MPDFDTSFFPYLLYTSIQLITPSKAASGQRMPKNFPNTQNGNFEIQKDFHAQKPNIF